MVQFYLWFKFYFSLFQTNYHTLPYPKTEKNKIKTKGKIKPQHLHHKIAEIHVDLAVQWNRTNTAANSP